MLGKLKTFLKWLLLLGITIIVIFGIYRREYLSQAIPVYMQYLEQKEKWENINTGNYVYIFYQSTQPPAILLFVAEGNTVRYKIFETDFELNSIANKYQTDKYLEITKTPINIDELFEIINHLILENVWESLLSIEGAKSSYKYITISYN